MPTPLVLSAFLRCVYSEYVCGIPLPIPVSVVLIIFIYLFLDALSLRCYAWAFSSCGERGLLFVAVHGLLVAVASLVVKHRLWVCRLQ